MKFTIDTPAAAQILGCTNSTILNYLNSGKFPSTPPNKNGSRSKHRFVLSEVQELKKVLEAEKLLRGKNKRAISTKGIAESLIRIEEKLDKLLVK
jgi:predicted DNA-binding transcriptional regulator AlpA